ncbi:thiol:disulfide interchange protein DsbA [Enterobacteriaceae bacterium LUAb1]
MKKIWFAIIGLMMTVIFSTAMAETFTEGKQYTTLPKAVQGAPKVMEFFSFFCPHCYQFEDIYHVGDAVQKNLPEGTKVIKYHVDFMGGKLGPLVTQAWSVAMALGIEDKVIQPLFEGIQKTQDIRDPASLKATFIKAAGITGEQYNAAWNSFAVKALVAQQQKAAADIDLRGVPAMFVKGKYMINLSGLDTSSMDNFVAEYANVVRFLVNKK